MTVSSCLYFESICMYMNVCVCRDVSMPLTLSIFLICVYVVCVCIRKVEVCAHACLPRLFLEPVCMYMHVFLPDGLVSRNPVTGSVSRVLSLRLQLQSLMEMDRKCHQNFTGMAGELGKTRSKTNQHDREDLSLC